MNTRHTLFIFVWMLLSLPAFGRGYSPTIFPSYANLPLKARLWFESVSRFDNPGFEEELASVPEAESALVELMKHIIADPDGDYEHLVDVIGSLRVRDDFSAEHQVWLRELLLSKLGRTKSPMESYLKGYGPGLLAKYPSPENEDLMIKYLKDKDIYNAVPEYDFGMSIAAVRALEKIGTAKSIGPLREYLDQFKPEGYKEVSDVIAVIEERKKQRASAPQTQATESQNFSKLAANPERESLEQTHSEELITGAVIALAVLALGWLTFQKWRKKDSGGDS